MGFGFRLVALVVVFLFGTFLSVFDCAFFVVAREERAGVCFAVPCAPFVLFFETGLFVFFDGDTDDLHCWSVAVIRVTRRD